MKMLRVEVEITAVLRDEPARDGEKMAAEVIRQMMTSTLYNAVATPEQRKMTSLFNELHKLAWDSESADKPVHYVGELDDVFKNYGF